MFFRRYCATVDAIESYECKSLSAGLKQLNDLENAGLQEGVPVVITYRDLHNLHAILEKSLTYAGISLCPQVLFHAKFTRIGAQLWCKILLRRGNWYLTRGSDLDSHHAVMSSSATLDSFDDAGYLPNISQSPQFVRNS